MNKTPKAPRGWRKLRNGRLIHKGDKFYNWFLRKWVPVQELSTYSKTGEAFTGQFVYIRRLPKKVRKK